MSILCCTASTNRDLFFTDLMCMILQRILDPTPPNSNNTQDVDYFRLARGRSLTSSLAEARPSGPHAERNSLC